MTDEHKDLVVRKFKEKLGLESFCFSSYTQQSVLFTDFNILSKLLGKWIETKTFIPVNEQDLLVSLMNNYFEVEERLKGVELEKKYKEYRSKYVDKINKVFDSKHLNLIKIEDVPLHSLIKKYYDLVIDSTNFFKLMTKIDVEKVINLSINQYNIEFSVEDDFTELIKLADKSLWYKEWDFLSKI